MRPEEALACGIIEQAIADYRDLMKRNVTQYTKVLTSRYSIKELECFFASRWCAELLDIINCKFTGNDILNMVREQCAQIGGVA